METAYRQARAEAWLRCQSHNPGERKQWLRPRYQHYEWTKIVLFGYIVKIEPI